MNTNYIVALYGGRRRMLKDKSPSRRNLHSPLKDYVNKHCDFIKTNPKGIDQITFVFNESNNPDEDKIIDYTKNLSLNIPHLVIVRENLNISYGAWGEGLKQTAKDFEYSILIEDDYIPVKNDFLDYFKSEIKDNSIFVASYFTNDSRMGPHASVSNGLIINKHINLENPFHHPPKTKNRDNYHHAAQNQIFFLKQYQDKGLIINDISKIAYTIYKQSSTQYYNFPKQPKGNPLLIQPFDYVPKS
jgi:hypothetical protein